MKKIFTILLSAVILGVCSVPEAISGSRPVASKQSQDSSSAVITKAWIETGVIQKGIEGVTFHADFDLKNVKNKLICCQVMYFSRPGGWALVDKNGRYVVSPSLKYIASFEFMRPTAKDVTLSDVGVFIPVEELHLTPGKKYRIYAQLTITSNPGNEGQFLTESDFLPITVDMRDPHHPVAVPDYTKSFTVAEVRQAKAEGRQAGTPMLAARKSSHKTPVVSSSPVAVGNQAQQSTVGTSWETRNSNVKKVAIDPATFWLKEEVDSLSLPKVYIE